MARKAACEHEVERHSEQHPARRDLHGDGEACGEPCQDKSRRTLLQGPEERERGDHRGGALDEIRHPTDENKSNGGREPGSCHHADPGLWPGSPGEPRGQKIDEQKAGGADQERRSAQPLNTSAEDRLQAGSEIGEMGRLPRFGENRIRSRWLDHAEHWPYLGDHKAAPLRAPRKVIRCLER